MNSRFGYIYRDASNWKKYGEVVFAGAPDEGLVQRLVATLDSGELFIAEQVRVPDLFFDDWPDEQEDHCWHEFHGLKATDQAPTDEFSRSIEEFVTECEDAARPGWRIFDAMSRKPSHGRPFRGSRG